MYYDIIQYTKQSLDRTGGLKLSQLKAILLEENKHQTVP